jgi:predicted lipase
VKLYKILGAVFLFSVFILSACSDDRKEYNFYGKGNNWAVNFETEVTKEREFGEYTIKYIGKEAAPEVFVYKIKSASFDVGTEDTFNEENSVHSGSVECTGCEVYTTEDEKIEAMLEWNGKSEIIKLDNKK